MKRLPRKGFGVLLVSEKGSGGSPLKISVITRSVPVLNNETTGVFGRSRNPCPRSRSRDERGLDRVGDVCLLRIIIAPNLFI